MSSTGGRGRKKRGAGSTPDGDTCDQVSLHRRNLYYFSYPLLALFALFRFLAVHCGVLFARLCEGLSRAMATTSKTQSNPQGNNKVCEDSGELIRNHHKQAFEYISVALRKDEDDKGMVCVHSLFTGYPPGCLAKSRKRMGCDSGCS